MKFIVIALGIVAVTVWFTPVVAMLIAGGSGAMAVALWPNDDSEDEKVS